MLPSRLTLRGAVELALELHPASMDWAWVPEERRAVRAAIVGWVDDYARRRGVVVSRVDVESEFDAVVAERRRRT